MAQGETEWMKVPEAAAYFRIPRSRMYELVQRGSCPPYESEKGASA